MSEKFLKHLPISNGKTKQNKKDHGLTGSSPVEICIEVNCLKSLIISYLKIGRKKRLLQKHWWANADLHGMVLEDLIKGWTLHGTKQNFPKNPKFLSPWNSTSPKDQTSSGSPVSQMWLPDCLYAPSPPEPLPPSRATHVLGSQGFSNSVLP